ncbi:TonB-dependent copper receptor [Lysobacter sp. K5869]|uniref:TonB-dependent copper receptor n=1 Tax=Lysobacter sp. K5869 TaxID=2820808 RepID=UPI001C0622D1|nr:TonB-dependent copper receptor [Lysobacter sp. K5869]QWP75213.1 TonB-dependent copper receptor [Lysobacter sp. K5869]
MTLRTLALRCAVLQALGLHGALAAEAPAGRVDPAQTLDAVVVTAAPVSALTFELDPKLPRQPVPASDGADYLKTVPGFTAIRNGGTNGDPVLRGMFGSRLNLLSNDGSMPGACPARMDNPLSYVSPETYDRVVVVKGPQTVLWGPGASAGTVRFVRRTEAFERPGVRANGSALGGSFGRNDQRVDIVAGAPLGFARLAANRSEADDYDDGNGQPVPSSWKKWNADASVGWTPDADTVVELAAGAGDGEARYAGRSMDGARFKRESYSVRAEKKNFGGRLSALEANAFYNYADHVMDNYSLREPNPMSAMPMPVAANVDRLTVGGRAAASWRWTSLDLTAGVDGQRSRHRERSGLGRDTYRAAPWSADARFSTVGAFAEATWRASASSRLAYGARIDRARVEDQRATAGMMALPNPTFGETRRESLPSGFVRYERDLAGSRAGWYAGIGHVERMPDYWELFSPNLGPAGAPNAFAGIAPEKTTQLDVGFQYKSERVDAWVSAYAGRIGDYILFAYQPGGMMGTMSRARNVDARIRGAEAGADWRPAEHWKLGATLAYAWGENRSDGGALPQMPPLDAKLTLNYDDKRWNFGALLRASAKQTRIAVGQGNVTGQDIGRSRGFAVFSLNGGYRFSDRARLSAGLDNVFDRAYSEHLNLAGSADFGYPAEPVRINEPGRSAWVKLDVSY